MFMPMSDDDRIKLLKAESPMCLCGREWTPARIPMGYIRMCPTCVMSASFCLCEFVGAAPGEYNHA